MQTSVNTAVIAVAGWGTRWLPLTKSIEKCMVPVGTRPVVDWAVADCVQAGVTRIIFIIAEEHTQIRQYYSHHAELEAYLTHKNKPEALEQVRQPQYQGVEFEFIVQPTGNYGTAIPVALAATSVQSGEPFLYLMGDDFLYRPDGGSEIADLCAAWQASGAQAAVMTKEVPREEATKFGVVFTNDQGEFDHIHEKPSLEVLAEVLRPSINLGKYIVSPEIARLTTDYVAKPSVNADGEYYITDIFGAAAAAGQRTCVYFAKGEHLDTGTPTNWFKTNQRIMEK